MTSHIRHILPVLLLALLFPAGCANQSPSTTEATVRHQLAEAGDTIRPNGKKPALPRLAEQSPASDYLRFALLNHPKVEAAYFEWQAAVAAIAPAKALPDPQLTFQADIASTITSLMPGLMFDLMAPGKREAMGREASASSELARRAYMATLVSTAADLRKAWIELIYLNEAIALQNAKATILNQTLSAVEAEYATGQGLGGFEEQTRLHDAHSRLERELASYADRQHAARARFKAALGLDRADADPAWPTVAWPETPTPTEDEAWAKVVSANPSLGTMRSMVDMAVTQVQLARTSQTPNFSAGLMVDTKSDPLMYRPTASMSLPIWRSKIKAVIEVAASKRQAAEARLSSERLTMAVELSENFLMLREADRMIAYIDTAGRPNLAKARQSAENAYVTGRSGLSPLNELKLMDLSMQIERLDARRDRDLALASLAALAASDLPQS